jgi:hypothetical protein
MRTTLLILNETYKTGVGRTSGEKYEMLTVRAADKSLPKEARCKSIMEITLAKEDNDLRGKLEDETVEVDILEIRGEFRGSVQAAGRLVRP